MSYVLNVTPQEYASIHEAWAITGPEHEGDFIARVRSICGWLPVAGHVRLVVRYDVPYIPWYSAGVERLEREPGHEKAG